MPEFPQRWFFIKALGLPKCVLHNADFETLIGYLQRETLFKQIKIIKLEKLIFKNLHDSSEPLICQPILRILL